MNKKIRIISIIIGILLLSGIIFLVYFKFGIQSSREDGAVRVTNCWPQSCQNPVFSPDGKYVMYTRFEKGYNKGPAKLVKVNLETKKTSSFAKATGDEQVIIDLEGDNVNVPFGSWIGNKIVFSYESGIALADDDGTNIEYLLKNKNNEFYIEPVFNPTNTNEIVFEIIKGGKHQIGLLQGWDSSSPEGLRMTPLTDGSFDDRLPSWSPDGKKILWQRSEYGQDNWQIMLADITRSSNSTSVILNEVKNLTQGPTDTDNSWAWDGKWILSSRTGGGEIPNIFAISTDGKNIKRITQSDHEDSAPSASPDGDWVAFESHRTRNPNSPTEIWIIKDSNQ